MIDIDYQKLCADNSREEFVAMCPFGFLVRTKPLNAPRAPRRTQAMAIVDFDEQETTLPAETEPASKPQATLEILAVRKVQPTFPEMITVGRTANNDIVTRDISVSKFHAVFSDRDGVVSLCDSGSRNGTVVNGMRLEARGTAVPIDNGDEIQLGSVDFRYYDAGSLWDRFRE